MLPRDAFCEPVNGVCGGCLWVCVSVRAPLCPYGVSACSEIVWRNVLGSDNTMCLLYECNHCDVHSYERVQYALLNACTVCLDIYDINSTMSTSK